MTNIIEALKSIDKFKSDSLTKKIASIEHRIIGYGSVEAQRYCKKLEINNDFISSAALIKRLSAEIDVVIHSSGILASLPKILIEGEIIENTSLGAGNTGKKFDLETNYRVAEYKFIDWKGGSESIRQNGIFKDFFELAESETTKKKFLYVRGTEHPLKFFNSGRALTSVLSKLPIILEKIRKKYSSDIVQVKDYYLLKKDDVTIQDISPYIE